MTSNPIRIPDDGHPIAIGRNLSRVVVRVGGKVVADTVRALTLREAVCIDEWERKGAGK